MNFHPTKSGLESTGTEEILRNKSRTILRTRVPCSDTQFSNRNWVWRTQFRTETLTQSMNLKGSGQRSKCFTSTIITQTKDLNSTNLIAGSTCRIPTRDVKTIHTNVSSPWCKDQCGLWMTRRTRDTVEVFKVLRTGRNYEMTRSWVPRHIRPSSQVQSDLRFWTESRRDREEDLLRDRREEIRKRKYNLLINYTFP